ncbi:dienelactone hydrolase family protein [Metapseudomonas resinovorans]|uniref:alpha/beta hydrolase family protein n=1 Tax=Metapseudomonas resinovorans TaxID=53412 RepID=UPI00059F5FE5|nr:lipoprotein [Pseudomonas resinovorans]
MVRLSAILALMALLAPVAALSAPAVGMHWLALADPLVESQPLNAVAFYPAQGRPRSSEVDVYRVDAAQDAPLAAGRFPLVVISHGNNGSPFAHHDLATALAKAGFIVVAVLHTGDNYQDRSRAGTFSNLYGRPLQLSAAIDSVQSDPLLMAGLDSRRVGVIGYSAGGESALILAGAQPEPERLRAYCRQWPDDQDACGSGGALIPDRDDLSAFADPRVGAVMLMAPLALMFDRKGLEPVRVPVLIYSGDADRILQLEQNAAALAQQLPIPPDFRLLPGAGHFVFMAPCPEALEAVAPHVCEDADGVDRNAIHERLSVEAVRFFSRTLGGSQPDSAGGG